MHAGVKLVIGVIILLAGLYWYAAPGFSLFGANTLHSLAVVFMGLFGLFLIVLGVIIAWIEYEDLKWERKEKTAKKTTKKEKEKKD